MDKIIALDNPMVLSWTKGEKIIASKWSKNEANLRVVSQRKDGFLNLYRFFYLGETVQVSNDSGTCNINKILDIVLNLIK